MDTGVYPYHPEFGGRVDLNATDAMREYLRQHQPFSLDVPDNPCWTYPAPDRNGSNPSHGTAVASVAAGAHFGVAKGATLVDVKATNCGGDHVSARDIAILEWITHHDPQRVPGKSVINFSASGLWYFDHNNDWSALSAAIAHVVDAPEHNIPFVAAAGNANDNVWWYAPAWAPRAITVGGMSRDADTKWYMSNYGNTTSFYAPAQYVESASLKIRALGADRDYVRSELDDNALCTDTCNSGTSFAAPHMTGVIARYLERHPGATRDQIVAELQRQNAVYSGARVYEPGTGQYVPVLILNECP